MDDNGFFIEHVSIEELGRVTAVQPQEIDIYRALPGTENDKMDWDFESVDKHFFCLDAAKSFLKHRGLVFGAVNVLLCNHQRQPRLKT